MGTVTIGNCQCQCYINYVSCDMSCEGNEIRTIRSNRFTEQSTRQRSKKHSPGDSSERQSKFSSTRKPSSRSNSANSKYLLSEFCNITSESSKQTKKKNKLHPTFIKSRSLYLFNSAPELGTDKEFSNKAEQGNPSISEVGSILDKVGALKKQSETSLGQQKKIVKWNLPQHYLSNKSNQYQQEFYA